MQVAPKVEPGNLISGLLVKGRLGSRTFVVDVVQMAKVMGAFVPRSLPTLRLRLQL